MVSIVQFGQLVRPREGVADLLARFAAGMAILVLNTADVVTTRLMTERGGQEFNPVAGWFLANGWLTEAKMAAAAMLAALLLVAPSRRWIPKALSAVAAVYLAVVLSHVAQLNGA